MNCSDWYYLISVDNIVKVSRHSVYTDGEENINSRVASCILPCSPLIIAILFSILFVYTNMIFRVMAFMNSLNY